MSDAGGAAVAPAIGRRLRAVRDHQDLSREELAFRSGLSWSAIAQIESGRRTNVRPSTLWRLAETLGVSVDYLLGRAADAGATLEHHALLYASPDELLETAVPYLAEGIARSQATLAVTSAANIACLRKGLGRRGSKVEFVPSSRWYTEPVSALSAYGRFIEQGLERGSGWIRILSEPIWAGRSPSEVRRWTLYESLMNLVFARAPVTVMCPYDVAALEPRIAQQARVTHRHACLRGETAASPAYVEPSAFALAP